MTLVTNKMVTKRIRSEYMKKFKDPKWETYTRCYEEMLKYRLTRRLLEHTHNPWFWSGSDSDSETGGRSPRLPPTRNQVEAEQSDVKAEVELEECEQARIDQQQEVNTTSTVPLLKLPLPNEESDASALCGSESRGVRKTRVPQEEKEEQRNTSKGSKQLISSQVKDGRRAKSRQTKPPKSVKPTLHSQQRQPAALSQQKEESKGNRPPFALYGSGERDADTAARKTHNVGPAASTNEIHESALRAQTRRRVERHFQSQRSERRRAKSADLVKVKSVAQPEFNPWLTEYMRCFSTRSR